MMRIDAHQHFWRLAERAGEWPGSDLAPIYRDFVPADLAPLLEQHAVTSTVLVQSMESEDETLRLLAFAQRHAFIAAVVGWTDLKHADAPKRIAALAQHGKLRGLRPMLQTLADDGWIDDPALAPAVAAMQQHRLNFDALVMPRHLPALLAFAERFPALPVVIDHCAKPGIASGTLEPWRADIARLAALPQVHCKLSGLVTEARPDWQLADLQPYVRHVLDVFGPERVIWGSDWPVLNLASDYAGWIAASEAALAHLDTPARERIFGLNAKSFYRID
jgi:L-fuconolactonase